MRDSGRGHVDPHPVMGVPGHQRCRLASKADVPRGGRINRKIRAISLALKMPCEFAFGVRLIPHGGAKNNNARQPVSPANTSNGKNVDTVQSVYDLEPVTLIPEVPSPKKLLKEAKAEAHQHPFDLLDYCDVIDILFRKGFSYAQIAKWLSVRLEDTVKRGQIYYVYQLWLQKQENVIDLPRICWAVSRVIPPRSE